VLPQEELVAPTGAATMGFDRPGSGIEERPMSDTDRAPLAWENQLFGPPSASRQRGMAAFDRWKRATVAISISAELWARRKAEVSALPTRHGPTDHAALVLDDGGTFHGICAAEGCRFLGTDRVAPAQALGDARRHATQRNRARGDT